MQTMTGYKRKQKSPPVSESRSVHDTANEFNSFYARFDDKCFDAESKRIVNTLKQFNDTPIVCQYNDVVTQVLQTHSSKKIYGTGQSLWESTQNMCLAISHPFCHSFSRIFEPKPCPIVLEIIDNNTSGQNTPSI